MLKQGDLIRPIFSAQINEPVLKKSFFEVIARWSATFKYFIRSAVGVDPPLWGIMTT